MTELMSGKSIYMIDYIKHNINKEFKMNMYQYHFTSLQNYIPIYKEFFKLNNSNYNSIQLNHPWYIKSIIEEDESANRSYQATVYQPKINKLKNTRVYIKEAPIVDPFKLLTGEMAPMLDKMIKLPILETSSQYHPKISNPYNSAYVDGLFNYLNGLLLPYGFIHGIEFYGSFLAIKKDYTFNIADDLEYLLVSKYFRKNNGTLFTVPNELFINTEPSTPFGNIILSDTIPTKIDDIIDLSNEEYNTSYGVQDDTPIILISDTIKDVSKEDEDIENISEVDSFDGSSIDSSDDFFTNSEDLIRYHEVDNIKKDIFSEDVNNMVKKDSESIDSNLTVDTSSISTDSVDGEIIATIPLFPIQMICIEKCNDTLDSLLGDNELGEDELFSCMAQVIFILLTYQKAFGFTHNDLHTNNIVFTDTHKKFIVYTYNDVQYKIPTYGKIYKIIDFGRSIFHLHNHLVCSDSYNKKEDAYSQYNFGPCYNSEKPLVEPNYSFDLCRLACSMIDIFIHDYDNIHEHTPFSKLLLHLCMDDTGTHVLYKKNGEERYPDFKLYKMIARTVHNHTPELVLGMEYFQHYISTEKIPANVKHTHHINIDNLLSQVRTLEVL